MILVGLVANEEDKKEIMLIAQRFLVGIRARELAKQIGGKNESDNKKKDK